MWLPLRSPFRIPLLGITPQFLDLFFCQLFSADELIRRFADQNEFVQLRLNRCRVPICECWRMKIIRNVATVVPGCHQLPCVAIIEDRSGYLPNRSCETGHLDEEKATDEALTEIAKTAVNQEAEAV